MRRPPAERCIALGARLKPGSRCRAFSRQEDGAVLIETALVYMLMMTCVLGIIELCMMTYTYSVYADAARQGVRYATFHGKNSGANCSGPGCTDSSGGNVVSVVTAYAAGYTAPVSGMTIVPNYPDGTNAPPSRVTVTIRYTYQPLFLLPGASHVFQVSSQGRIFF